MEKTTLKIKVSTGKPQFKIDVVGELLLIEIESNPEKGKANKEIVKRLKKIFKSEVEIVSGLKSREKIVEVKSSKEDIMRKLKS